MRPHRPRVRRLSVACAAALAALTTASLVSSGTATAAPGSTTAPTAASAYLNPLAPRSNWSVYQGGSDGLYPAYQQATGTAKTLLGRMALQPHVRWYTSYLSTRDVGPKIRDDIVQQQHGDANKLVWMATFRLWPYTEGARWQPLSSHDISAYKAWVLHAARGIGHARVALVLEPDLAVVMHSWKPSVRLGLVRYAAQVFSNLPRTTVYLDGSSSDWLPVASDVWMLRRAGIRYVHGFAVGSTHHPGAAAEIRYATQVAVGLARAGYGNKHFIIDTSDNGHGYTYQRFERVYPNGNYNDPPACQTKTQQVCVSLGIPPTTDVTNSKWHLPPRLYPTLRERCDAFIWIGRPWLGNNGHEFDRAKALDVARTSPYFG